jgi:hypothetical protein
MIFRTENTLYEVRPTERRFRHLQRDAEGRISPAGSWLTYERVGTVAIGERVRFFLPGTTATEPARTWTTTPVRELLAAV